MGPATGSCLCGGVRFELTQPFRRGTAKAFRSACGSSPFGGTWPDGPEVSVRFGASVGDPGIRPERDSHTTSAAPWDETAA